MDGSDVLTWLKSNDTIRPDMILLDAMMAVMDGFATCEAIKELPNGQDVPILMITARDDAAAIDRAFDCGAEDYIVKPFNMTLLRRRMDLILKARRDDEIIRLMAFHDPLTGLPNRRLFEIELSRWLSHAQRSGEPLAVVILDLDRFKQVNDNLGHAAGDNLLVEMARRFQSAVRTADFVARLGGDEFMMILPGVSNHRTLLPVASSLFEACDRPISLGGVEIRIGVSVGVSIFPWDGSDINTLMKKADLALYQSKRKNGNTFTCFSDSK